MYYKSNIELIYLFATNIKYYISLQVYTFNKKFQIFFREFPVPISSRPGPNRDGTSSGRDMGRKPCPVSFSGQDTGYRCPDLVLSTALI